MEMEVIKMIDWMQRVRILCQRCRASRMEILTRKRELRRLSTAASWETNAVSVHLAACYARCALYCIYLILSSNRLLLLILTNGLRSKLENIIICELHGSTLQHPRLKWSNNVEEKQFWCCGVYVIVLPRLEC